MTSIDSGPASPSRGGGRGRRAPTPVALAALGLLAAAAVALVMSSGGGSSAPDPGGDESANVPVPPGQVRFGYNDAYQVGTLRGALVRLASLAGADAARFPLDWRLAEPRPGVWSEAIWSSYERAYDSILARRMTPVIDFGFAPAWAREPGPPRSCRDFDVCRYPPARSMDGAWAGFASRIARGFPKAVLEVWNEPNTANFWRPAPDPERFAELQAIAYRAIKAVNPSQTVLAGGLAAVLGPGSSTAAPIGRFLDRAYASDPGLKGNMDAISFHPYPDGGDLGADSAFARSFADVRGAAAAHGDAGERLWVTETGFPTEDMSAFSEVEQADALVRLYRRLATMSDVDGILIHRLLPAGSPGSTDYGYALLGSARAPFAPKAAYCVFVKMAGNSYPGC